jgi:anti-anti-sigma factor
MLQTCDRSEIIEIHFEGRLDTATCARIDADVRNAVTKPDRPIVFDLGGVDFVSSSFLRLCVYAYQQAANRGFRIANLGPSVKRVFKIAGFDSMLEIE